MEVTGVLDKIYFGKVGGTQPDWNIWRFLKMLNKMLRYDLAITLLDIRDN